MPAAPAALIRHYKIKVTVGEFYGPFPVRELRAAGCRVILRWGKVTAAGKALGVSSWSYSWDHCPPKFDDAEFFAVYSDSQRQS